MKSDVVQINIINLGQKNISFDSTIARTVCSNSFTNILKKYQPILPFDHNALQNAVDDKGSDQLFVNFRFPI